MFDAAQSAAERDALFGSFVEGQRDESRWRRRLVAIAIGLVHGAIYFSI